MENNKNQFLILIIGKVLQIFLMLGALKLSTHLLKPDEIGRVYLFTTIYTFFVFFLISPVGQYFNRFTHKWESNGILMGKLKLYFIYMAVVSLFSLVCSLVLFYIDKSPLAPLFTFISLNSLFVFVVSANQTVVSLLNMLNHRVLFVVFSCGTSFFSLVCSIGLMIYIEQSAILWLIGLLVGNFIMLVFSYIFLSERLPENKLYLNCSIKTLLSDRIKCASLFKFAIPVGIASLFMWAQNSGYRLNIESSLGLDYLGNLAVGLMVAAQISSVVETVMSQYYSPILFRTMNNLNYRQRLEAINKYFRRTIPVYLALAIFLSVSIMYVYPLLVSSTYASGYKVCIFGVWIEFFRIMTNVIGTIAHSEVKMKGYMYSYMIGALCANLFVYFAAGVKSETDLVPIALLLAMFVTFILMSINMRQLMSYSVGWFQIILSVVLVIPTVYYFNVITFSSDISFIYIVKLCIGGSVFLMGLYLLYCIDRTLYG